MLSESILYGIKIFWIDMLTNNMTISNQNIMNKNLSMIFMIEEEIYKTDANYFL